MYFSVIACRQNENEGGEDCQNLLGCYGNDDKGKKNYTYNLRCKLFVEVHTRLCLWYTATT